MRTQPQEEHAITEEAKQNETQSKREQKRLAKNDQNTKGPETNDPNRHDQKISDDRKTKWTIRQNQQKTNARFQSDPEDKAKQT